MPCYIIAIVSHFRDAQYQSVVSCDRHRNIHSKLDVGEGFPNWQQRLIYLVLLEGNFLFMSGDTYVDTGSRYPGS